MAVRPQFLAYVLEQLSGLGNVHSRRMFGGVGLYSAELFFGLIDDDTVFFKTDASNSGDYTARRMPRFMPFPTRPDAVMAYHQVPLDVVEDDEMLRAWARKSIAVALVSLAAKSRPKGEGKGRAPKRKATARKKASRTASAARRATRGKTR